MKKLLGQFLCWMGAHDWYEGITKTYCLRCDEVLFEVKMDAD